MALREDLELDIGAALSSVDRLEGTLRQVAQRFKGELGDALSALNVDVDVRGVTSAVSDAVQSADTEVEITGDAEAVTSAVSTAVEDADATAVVEGDAAAVTDAVDSAVAESDTTVELTAELDTGQVQGEIAGLTGGFQELGEGAGEAAGPGGVGGLAGAVDGFGVKAAATVGGVAGLVATTKELFTSAVEAEGSVQAFNLRLGDMAAEVRQVDVGGLDEDLGELAIRLGSSDEGLQNAAARIFELGQSAGIASPEVAETTEQIIALAARAVALNPSLGDVGQVAETMTNALARGGRSAATFGLTLTSAEIEARALADTGKTSATELTIFEKAAAGAAIASEQLGTSLAEDVNAGAENAQIQLRSLQERLGEAFETAGAPVVVPLFDLLESALPTVTSLLTILASVVRAVAPAFQAVFAVVEPILGFFAEGLSLTADAVVEFVSRSAAALGEFLHLFDDLLNVVDTVLGPVDEAIGGLFSSGSDAAAANFDLAEGADAAATALGGQAASADQVAAAMSGAAAEFGRYIEQSSRFSKDDDVLEQLRGTGLGFEQLQGLLENTGGGIKAFTAAAIDAGQIEIEIDGVVQTADDIANLDGNLNALLTSGDAVVTKNEDLVASFNQEQRSLEKAADAQLSFLLRSGEITEEQRAQAVAMANASGAGGSYQEVLRLLTTDLESVDAALETTNEKLAAQEVVLGANAQSWVNLAASVLAGQTGIGDAAAVAEQLGVPLEQVEGFIKNVTSALDGFVSAGLSGLPQVGDAFVDLNEDQKVSLAEFRKTLDEQTAAIAEFPNTVRTLLALGFDDIAQLAIDRGPEFTRQLASEIQAGGPEVATALEGSLEGFRTETAETEAFLRNEAGPALLSSTTAAAQQAAAGFETPLNFDGTMADKVGLAEVALTTATPSLVAAAQFAGISVEEAYAIQLGLPDATSAAVGNAQLAIDQGTPGLSSAATTAGGEAAAGFESGADFEAGVRRNIALGRAGFDITSSVLVPFALFAGQDVGRAFDDGIALGIITHSGVVRDAARYAVASAEAAAVAAAQIGSPSQLFADEVGEPIAQGIALGVEQGAGDIARSIDQLVGAGVAAGIGSTPNAAPSGGSTIVFDVSVVAEGATTQAEAEALGRGIVAGGRQALARRHTITDARL